MTDFQIGDKVKSIRVGTIVGPLDHFGRFVTVQHGVDPTCRYEYPITALELVERPAPPVKVGDTVTAKNVDALPRLAVVVAGGDAYQNKGRNLWRCAHAGDDYDNVFLVHYTTAPTVVHLPAS